MKRVIIVLLVLVSMFSFVSCKDEPEPPKSYVVTFDKNGHGTAPGSQTIQEGQKVTEPDAPTVAGMVFGGWYKEAGCANAWNFASDVVTADITLYAKWTVAQYTVTFDMKGHGSAVNAQTVDHGTPAEEPAAPTDNDYVFLGWCSDESCENAHTFSSVILGNTTLYAKWTPKKTITYHTEYGTLTAETDRVGLGLKITQPTAPTYAGYAFNGWYTEPGFQNQWNFTENTVQGDMDLYARWTQNCDAVFNMQGHGEQVVSQTSIPAGTKVGYPTPAPTATGYTFGGWFKEAECQHEWNFATDTVSENPTTLYAKWTANTYTITLEKNTGSANGTATATYGAGLSGITNPVKSGCTIEGFYTDTSYSKKVANGDGTLVSNVSGYTDSDGKWIKLEGCILYARWNYTITFQDPDNLLTSVPNSVTVTQGNKLANPNATPKAAAEARYGYRWSSVAPNSYEQQAAYDFNSYPTSSMTLYYLKTYTNGDFVVEVVNGKNYIKSYIGNDTILTIPANIDGYKIYSLPGGTSQSPFNSSSKSSITSVIISEGIETVPDYLFKDFTSLQSVTFPNSITYFGNYVFGECSSLTTVVFPDVVSFHTMGTGCFRGCTSLNNVSIPEGVVRIDNDFFSGCTNLKTVVFPSTITTIGSFLFYRATKVSSLTVSSGNEAYKSENNAIYTKDGTELVVLSPYVSEYEFPVSVTKIGKSAFYCCYQLTSMVIPDRITELSSNAFNYCSGLTSVTIPDGITEIPDYCFANCTALTSVNIPDSVTSLGKDCFYYCTSMTSYVIPSSVVSMGEAAFSCGFKLTSVTIPNSIKTIPQQAFHTCKKLTTLNIPASVETIGANAFSYCTELNTVILNSTTMYQYPEKLLKEDPALTSIKVPAALVDQYKAAAGWSDFAAIISAIE